MSQKLGFQLGAIQAYGGSPKRQSHKEGGSSSYWRCDHGTLVPSYPLSTSDTLSDQYNDALPQHRPQINETTTLTAELNEAFPLSKFFCLRKLTNTEVDCKTKTSPRETQDIGLLTPDTTVIQSTDNIKV